MDDVSQRLGDIEAGLAQLRSDRYPHGPLYFGDHTALVATRWGAKMLVDTRDAAISPWIVLDGLWETHVTAWLQQTLQPGQVFVDVGANVGYFTLLVHSSWARGEGRGRRGPPRSRRVAAPQRHHERALRIRHHLAPSGVVEHDQLQLHERLDFSGALSVGAIGSEALGRLGDSEEMVEVQAVPLDDLLEGLPPVDVLKMDIEGAELQAFAGLSRTLEASPKISVMFEWAPALMEAVGDKADALVDLWKDTACTSGSSKTASAPSSAPSSSTCPTGTSSRHADATGHHGGRRLAPSRDLAGALRGIGAVPADEVVVVDNGSTQEAASAVATSLGAHVVRPGPTSGSAAGWTWACATPAGP